jgi:hypothetical protein
VSNKLAKIMRKLKGDADEGIEQDESEALTPDEQLAASRGGVRLLTEAPESVVVSLARQRWDRGEKASRRLQAQIKVNMLRYGGRPFVQVHPNDPERVYIPSGATQRLPPSVNKIRRSVHRYTAQITADEPVMEGVPATSTDTARDQAEASTHILRGEWDRMNLHEELQRSVQVAAIMRSAFWFFEFDGTAGGRVKAQKFFTQEGTNERHLAFVDAKGNRVENEEDAAEIWQGEAKLHNLTPMNVRWEGARYAHDANEVTVGLLVKLRDLYEMAPKMREVKVSELLCDVPPDAEAWLRDVRAESQEPYDPYTPDSDTEEGVTGAQLKDEDSRLDANVFLLYHFLKPSRQYKGGFQAMIAGKHLVSRGTLKYGIIPIAHFKFLEEVADRMGISLVDILRDPQELLDFVNGQILRYLQSLKRRWFVPMHSGVKARDLLNPTRSIIEYNPNAGAPTPEVQSEIPNSLVDWSDRFERAYDDEAGMHDTMRGKHVPGVSSGRHAEALRSGDETLLGLSRTQMKMGLEAGSRVLLQIAKKEWTRERRVRYLGDDREYVELAFSGSDIGDTSKVQLKRSTLLMITPAQKLEILFGYAEMQAITPEELRRLAPLSDTAGVSLTEDPHYKRARRQNAKFLAGPPKKLVRAFEDFKKKTEMLQAQIPQFQEIAILGGANPGIAGEVNTALAQINMDLQAAEQEWTMALQAHAPSHRPWEDDPAISRIHAVEHQRALASDKVERFPEWWVELFEQHAVLEYTLAVPPQPAQGGGGGAPVAPANADGTVPAAPPVGAAA